MFTEKWNQNWLVWKETNAFRLISLPPADALHVDLPYDAAFHQPQDPDSPNQGKTGFLNGGTWHYAKEYYAPESERGMTIRLLFEGCAQKTYVFVNDSLAGECSYAYSAFEVDISSYLRYGATNRIVVTTTTLELSSRFYCGCGIYRDVYLCKGGSVYMEPGRMQLTTKSLRNGNAFVRLDMQIVSQAAYATEGVLQLTAKAQDEQTVWQVDYPVHLPGRKTYRFSRHFTIPQVMPWDAEQPALYQFHARLTDASGRLIDEETICTGFRTIQADGERGLQINGKTVKLLGGCIHHDQGILGAETYDEYEYRRVLLLKQAGFNAVRCAHNPASKALLRACDRLGMYVMDEAFDMWAKMKNPADYSLFFGQDYPKVLEAMVRSDYNHPSVIMYSTGNEIMDIATDKGYELSSELTACLRALDDTRLITNAINALLSAGNRLLAITAQANGDTLESLKGIDVNEYMAQHRLSMGQIIAHDSISDVLEHLDATMDVIGYNYMVDRYEADSVRYPQRIIVGAETHAPRIADHWRLMQQHANIIGDFIWTAYGYLGETGGKERFPALQNESCDLDVTGCRLPTAYYRAVVLGQRAEPYIAVRTPLDSLHPILLTPWSLTDAIHCWDYPGHEGQMTEVEVYSAGDEVELFLNGVSCGRKPAGEKRPCQTVFRVPYQPGELKAVSLCQGKPVSSYVLASTGKATGLKLTRETYPVENDLIFLSVQAVNAQGQAVYAGIEDLTVDIEGQSVRLQAFGSWNAPHQGGYQSPVLTIHNGQALLILRKRGSGESRITVSATGVEAATQTVVC